MAEIPLLLLVLVQLFDYDLSAKGVKTSSQKAFQVFKYLFYPGHLAATHCLSATIPLLCEGILAEDPGPIRARYQSYLTILKGGMLR